MALLDAWPTCSPESPACRSRRSQDREVPGGRPCLGMSTIPVPNGRDLRIRERCHSWHGARSAAVSTNGAAKCADPASCITFLTWFRNPVRIPLESPQSPRHHIPGAGTSHSSWTVPVNATPPSPAPGGEPAGSPIVRWPSSSASSSASSCSPSAASSRRCSSGTPRVREANRLDAPQPRRGAGPAARHPRQRAEGRRLQGHRPREPADQLAELADDIATPEALLASWTRPPRPAARRRPPSRGPADELRRLHRRHHRLHRPRGRRPGGHAGPLGGDPGRNDLTDGAVSAAKDALAAASADAQIVLDDAIARSQTISLIVARPAWSSSRPSAA